MKAAVSRARHRPVQEWPLRELLLYCCNFCSVVESIHAWVTSLLPKCHSLPKWTLLTTWMMERVKWGYTYLVTWHPYNNKRFDSLMEFPDIPHIGQSLAWQNSQHFATLYHWFDCKMKSEKQVQKFHTVWEVISPGSHWWHCKMSTVFSG